MTARPLTVLLGAALLAPAPVTAQAVLLRLAPPAGQVSAYDFRMDITMGMPQMGEMSMQTDMRMTQTVTAVEGDVRTIEMVIDSMSVTGGPGAEMNQISMDGVTMTVRMDSRGRQLGMEISGAPAGGAMGGQVPGLGGNAFPQTFTQIMLPEEPVAPGAEWTDTEPVEMGEGAAAMTLDKQFTYRFEGLDQQAGARHARLSVTGTMTMGGGGAMGMTADAEFSGTIVLDLDAGRFVNYSGRMDMLMEMPQLEAPMTMEMTMEGGLVPQD